MGVDVVVELGSELGSNRGWRRSEVERIGLSQIGNVDNMWITCGKLYRLCGKLCGKLWIVKNPGDIRLL